MRGACGLHCDESDAHAANDLDTQRWADVAYEKLKEIVEAEQDPKKANPLKYATMGFQSLSGFARDSGRARD